MKQNRGKSIQNRHPNCIPSMLEATLESHDSNRTILNRSILDSVCPFMSMHDLSGPVRDTPQITQYPFGGGGGIAPPLCMPSKKEMLRKGGGGMAPNWPC